jgi:hypothetical protein
MLRTKKAERLCRRPRWPASDGHVRRYVGDTVAAISPFGFGCEGTRRRRLSQRHQALPFPIPSRNRGSHCLGESWEHQV